MRQGKGFTGLSMLKIGEHPPDAAAADAEDEPDTGEIGPDGKNKKGNKKNQKKKKTNAQRKANQKKPTQV